MKTNAPMTVRFFSLAAADIAVVRTEQYPNAAAALSAVKSHADSGGYTTVRVVDGEDEGLRYTATTPGGRAGRNIAAADFGYNGDTESASTL